MNNYSKVGNRDDCLFLGLRCAKRGETGLVLFVYMEYLWKYCKYEA